MKKILMLLDNTFSNDRRVYKEALSLVNDGNRVILLAIKKNDLPDIEIKEGISVYRIFTKEIFDVKKYRIFSKYVDYILANFDLIHAHDQTMLHLGVQLKKKKKSLILIYDSHELFHAWPINTTAKGIIYIKTIIVRWYLKQREKKNIKNIDGLITVNESIRKNLLNYFKLNVKSISLRNIPEFENSNGRSNILREKFNIPESAFILVYIGSNIYPRTINIEQVIREFSNQENIFMVFICKFNWGKEAVEDYANKFGTKNLYFHDLVPPYQINKYLSDADVGILSAWNKRDLSYWFGLDNKLFEYMMAEIPILGTKQPEYVNIIERYNIGICINPDEEKYLDAFKLILSNYNQYKNNLIKAKKELNWENEKWKLLDFYKNF